MAIAVGMENEGGHFPLLSLVLLVRTALVSFQIVKNAGQGLLKAMVLLLVQAYCLESVAHYQNAWIGLERHLSESVNAKEL